MKILCLVCAVMSGTICFGQFRGVPTPNQYFHEIMYPAPHKNLFYGLSSDPVQTARHTSPVLTNLSYSDWRAPNSFFWTGTVTTQSFNKGKFGTLYYWDVQGNLRGTRGFIDISGKDKRGFKLVFPWKFFR
ncbi:MAG TPA: hypothetical protein VL728_18950 [Cyclobacteriaceae bacterium]|jgi:hypothetical protein|nr:hypothetical protein [Cyclobacteriaceae bacterium]